MSLPSLPPPAVRAPGAPCARTAVMAALAAGAALLLLAAGCGAAPATGAPSAPDPDGQVTASPAPVAGPARSAASAGGACRLLDFVEVGELLGLDFEVAAARRSRRTHACVLRTVAAPEPYLVLTIAPAQLDESTFVDDVAPEGASEVSALGKAAYQGPDLSVGWLSGDDRLLTLTLVPPAEAGTGEFADGLLELARAVDRYRS